MNMPILDARRGASGGYKVDVNRDERIGRVSIARDERFLSLDSLAQMVYSPARKAAGPASSKAR